ncbi:hypothetical protein [Actinophytocola sediminis]
MVRRAAGASSIARRTGSPVVDPDPGVARWWPAGADVPPGATTGIAGEAGDEVPCRPEALIVDTPAPAGEGAGVARVSSAALATGTTEDLAGAGPTLPPAGTSGDRDGSVPGSPSSTRWIGATEGVPLPPPMSPATGITGGADGRVPPATLAAGVTDDRDVPRAPPTERATVTTGDIDGEPLSSPSTLATGATDDRNGDVPALPLIFRATGVI